MKIQNIYCRDILGLQVSDHKKTQTNIYNYGVDINIPHSQQLKWTYSYARLNATITKKLMRRLTMPHCVNNLLAWSYAVWHFLQLADQRLGFNGTFSTVRLRYV